MTRRPLWLVGLFIAVLALGTDEFVIAGLLTEIADDLAITVGTAGQLVTGFAVAFALGAPAMGVLLDAFPRRRVLIGGLLVFAVANLAAAFAPSFGALLTSRVLAGLAAAAVSTTAFATAGQGAPEGKQGAYLATVTTGLTVALFTGVPFGSWVGGLFGWRSTFLLIAAVTALAIISIAVRLPHLPGVDGGDLRARLRPLRNAQVLRLVVAVFLCGSGGLMFYSYLAPILARVHGDTGPLAGVLLLVGVIGVPSAFLGGWLADRLGGRTSRLVVVGGHATALALLTLLVLTAAPLPLFLIGVALWSVFAWALNPPLQASTIEAAPDSPMGAIALNISGLYLGTAVAGGLGGIIVDSIGEAWIPPIAAALLAMAWISASFRATPSVPTQDVLGGQLESCHRVSSAWPPALRSGDAGARAGGAPMSSRSGEGLHDMTTTHILETDGAAIAYDIHGELPAPDGLPPLLMIGQPMDASGFTALASHFPDRAVVTYDPRGIGRSTRSDGQRDNVPTVQAGDVHALIAELGAGPVEMFASSGGAVTALALVAAYPDDVATLVAHEPPMIPALPDAESAERAFLTVRETYDAKGFGAGMAAFIAMSMWQGEFTDEFFAQPLPDPAMFGLPTEDDGSRGDPLLSDRSVAVTAYSPTSRHSQRRRRGS